MRVREYIAHSPTMSLREYLLLDEKTAIEFDFLTQGEEADRTPLTKEIYKAIFPWYDESKHAGDTLNTYRIAVKHFYGQYYGYLNRATQLEIVDTIKRYTPHSKNHIFEFDVITDSGFSYKQLSNNYQLGNFGIWRSRGGINPKRASEPYYDYFDRMFERIYHFYDDNLTSEDELDRAIINQSEYFHQFEDASDFVYQNYLQDFFVVDEEDDALVLAQLSEVDTFGDYVQMVTAIVEKRGRTIYKVMQHAFLEEKQIMSDKENDLEYLSGVSGVISQIEEVLQEHQQQYQTLLKMYPIKDYLNWKWYIPAIIVPILPGSWLHTTIMEFIYSIPGVGYLLFYILQFPLAILILLGPVAFLVFKTYTTWKYNRRATNEFEIADKQLDEERQRELNVVYSSEQYQRYAVGFPDEFFDSDDVATLYQLLSLGRADNLKEAFSILEKRKHHERLEQHAADQGMIAEQQLHEQREFHEQQMYALQQVENERYNQQQRVLVDEEKHRLKEEEFYQDVKERLPEKKKDSWW